MKKLYITAALVASLGLLTACQDKPEDKIDSARESMSDAAKNISDAAKDVGAAAKQKSEQVFNNEPTTGEKIQSKLDDAGDTIGEAYDESSNYLKEKGSEVKAAAKDAKEDLEQRLNKNDEQ